VSDSFVAIDFETANSSRASACEVGLVRIERGSIVGDFSTLLSPPPRFGGFNERHTRIHGITQADVRDAPEFKDVWFEIQRFIDGLPLVAHNASFDISVLRALLSEYQLDWPEKDYWCTLVLSKASLNLASYTLSSVSRAFGIRHESVHRAASDALTAGNVLISLLAENKAPDLESAGKQLRVSKGRMFRDGYFPCSGPSRTKATDEDLKSARFDALGLDAADPDASGDFQGKSVAITGTLHSMTRAEAESLLAAAGANVRTGVSSKLDYLVAGVQDLSRMVQGEVQSSKYRKVLELRMSGIDIEIIDEEQLLQMLRD
jgi:DNA polymerase-3 subunit epsilon